MKSTDNQSEFWLDGIFDSVSRQRREFYRDGELKRHADKVCCGIRHPHFDELRHPWSYFPDLPQSMEIAA